MNQIKIYFFLWTVTGLLNIETLWGQTPGYLGMKNHLNGTAFTMPSLRDTNSAINLMLLGGFSHIWTRSISTGGTYQWFSTQFGYKSKLTSRSGRGVINGWGIGVNARVYYLSTKGMIAPLGPFQEFQVSYQYYNVFDKYGRYFPPPYDISGYRFGGKGGFAAGTSFGEQRVVYKFFMISYGINFRYVFPEFHSNIKEEYISNIVHKRVRNFQIFSLSLGIGALIF